MWLPIELSINNRRARCLLLRMKNHPSPLHFSCSVNKKRTNEEKSFSLPFPDVDSRMDFEVQLHAMPVGSVIN